MISELHLAFSDWWFSKYCYPTLEKNARQAGLERNTPILKHLRDSEEASSKLYFVPSLVKNFFFFKKKNLGYKKLQYNYNI